MNKAIRDLIDYLVYFILGAITGGLVFGAITYLQYKGV
jgi:hypothetical protein